MARSQGASSTRAVGALVLGLGSLGCADDARTDVVLQTVAGAPPSLAGIVSVTTRTVQRGDDGRPTVVTEAVRDDAVRIAVRAREGRVDTYVTVALESSSGVSLTGGTPWFDPGSGERVPAFVGAPGSCTQVPGMQLSSARTAAATVVLGRHLLVLGGEGASGPVDALEAFDLRTLGRVHSTTSDVPLGRARAAAVDDDTVLVLTESGEAFTLAYDPRSGFGRRAPIALHDGGDTAVDVVSVPYKGAVVVGGGDPATPSRTVTWVAPNGLTSTLTLNAASGERVVTSGSIGLWVASTNAATFELEFVPNLDSPPIRRAPYNDGPRTGPTLLTDVSGSRLVFLGGVDDADVPRTDGYFVTGCPIACFTMPMSWPAARTGHTADRDGVLVGGVGADDTVEEVVIGSTGATVESFATLQTGRERPMVTRLPSGPTFVLGGRGPAGLLDDTELCFGPAR